MSRLLMTPVEVLEIVTELARLGSIELFMVVVECDRYQ
jgi:hypothetical protein